MKRGKTHHKEKERGSPMKYTSFLSNTRYTKKKKKKEKKGILSRFKKTAPI
jgi:hypothetical protein